MKPVPSPSGTTLTAAALALSLVLLIHDSAAAATPYSVETHGPRIGTRIVNFFKDLAYGQNPNDRYRRVAPPPVPSQPQQYSYGASARAPKYSLDSPPRIGSPRPTVAPATRPAPPVAIERDTPPDMPYPSSSTPDSATDPAPRAGIGGQQEALPPVLIKPKQSNPPAKTSRTASAPAPQQAPKVKSEPATKEKPAASEPASVAETSPATVPPSPAAASAVGDTTIRPWQRVPGGTQAPQSSTPSFNPPSESTPPPANSSPTLTGSKTGTEGRVRSPYPPYNELDVTGLPGGSLAMDPTTGKVFRVP